jgi:antitoxin CptB
MDHRELLSRLRWQCRRGMLELDVLLGKFLEEAFLNLPENEQDIFIKLLNNSDQDLYYWLTGQKVAPDVDEAMMIGKIRHHAQHRH